MKILIIGDNSAQWDEYTLCQAHICRHQDCMSQIFQTGEFIVKFSSSSSSALGWTLLGRCENFHWWHIIYWKSTLYILSHAQHFKLTCNSNPWHALWPSLIPVHWCSVHKNLSLTALGGDKGSGYLASAQAPECWGLSECFIDCFHLGSQSKGGHGVHSTGRSTYRWACA